MLQEFWCCGSASKQPRRPRRTRRGREQPRRRRAWKEEPWRWERAEGEAPVAAREESSRGARGGRSGNGGGAHGGRSGNCSDERGGRRRPARGGRAASGSQFAEGGRLGSAQRPRSPATSTEGGTGKESRWVIPRAAAAAAAPFHPASAPHLPPSLRADAASVAAPPRTDVAAPPLSARWSSPSLPPSLCAAAADAAAPPPEPPLKILDCFC